MMTEGRESETGGGHGKGLHGRTETATAKRLTAPSAE